MPRKNHSLPHTPYQPPKGCQTKQRFAREREAQKAAEDQMSLQPELELRVYKCPLCGGWHLTNATKK